MSEQELAAVLVTYKDSDGFATQLRATLDEYGMAIVDGILSAEERAEFEAMYWRELTAPSAQPAKTLTQKVWWVNAWTHAQGELAWKSRLHPKVVDTFKKIFG